MIKKHCRDCKFFVAAKRLENPRACIHLKCGRLLYSDVAVECEYYLVRKIILEKICKYCKIKFIPGRGNDGNFCSVKCVNNYYLGPKNPSWKGDKIKYRGLHAWIRKNKPAVTSCENCMMKKKSLDIANISGKYFRNIDDYMWLCRSCHIIYDKKKHNKSGVMGVWFCKDTGRWRTVFTFHGKRMSARCDTYDEAVKLSLKLRASWKSKMIKATKPKSCVR